MRANDSSSTHLAARCCCDWNVSSRQFARPIVLRSRRIVGANLMNVPFRGTHWHDLVRLPRLLFIIAAFGNCDSYLWLAGVSFINTAPDLWRPDALAAGLWPRERKKSGKLLGVHIKLLFWNIWQQMIMDASFAKWWVLALKITRAELQSIFEVKPTRECTL